jgi:hypothetical protein
MRYKYCPDPNNLRNVYCKANLSGARWQPYRECETIEEAQRLTDLLNQAESIDKGAMITYLQQQNAKLAAENFKLSAQLHVMKMREDHAKGEGPKSYVSNSFSQ